MWTLACFAVVLGMVLPACAQSDWRDVEAVKLKHFVIVETSGVNGSYTRCRLISIDAATLTCQEEGRHRPRLVFPASGVESVYRVGLSGGAKAKLVLGGIVLGCFIAGVATLNPALLTVGLFGGAFFLVAGVSDGMDAAWRGINGTPEGAFRDGESQEIVYHRAASDY